MRFDEKYISEEEKSKDPEKAKGKITLSNDAYALGEVLQSLKDETRRSRLDG